MHVRIGKGLGSGVGAVYVDRLYTALLPFQN